MRNKSDTTSIRSKAQTMADLKEPWPICRNVLSIELRIRSHHLKYCKPDISALLEAYADILDEAESPEIYAITHELISNDIKTRKLKEEDFGIPPVINPPPTEPFPEQDFINVLTAYRNKKIQELHKNTQ